MGSFAVSAGSFNSVTYLIGMGGGYNDYWASSWRSASNFLNVQTYGQVHQRSGSVGGGGRQRRKVDRLRGTRSTDELL